MNLGFTFLVITIISTTMAVSIEDLAEVISSSSSKAIKQAVVPIAARQDAMEQKYTDQFNSLQTMISSLSVSVLNSFQPTNPSNSISAAASEASDPHHRANISPGPPTQPPGSPTQPPDPQPQPASSSDLSGLAPPYNPNDLNIILSTSNLSNPSLQPCPQPKNPLPPITQCQDPVLLAASRTLGFSPVHPPPSSTDHNPPPSPQFLRESLTRFLSDKLKIPDTLINSLSFKQFFNHEDPAGIYVEFCHAQDINLIFRYISNLPKSSIVHRYIHPSVQARFEFLSEKAYKMRKRSENLQTKILYDKNNLNLFMKNLSNHIWRLDIDTSCGPIPLEVSGDHSPLSNHSDLSMESSWSPIQQMDGLDDIPNILDLPVQKPSIGQASYHLNQTKQATRITSDASRDDMEITVNNNDTNVNVQCSTGFFIRVAQPCLSSISQGTTKQYSTTQVVCSEFFKQVDKGGFLDFLRISFELSRKIPVGKGLCPPAQHF